MFRGCALKAGPGKRAQAWVQNWVLVTHGNLRTRWNKAVPCGVQYGQVLFKLCQRKLISTLTIGRSANSAALLLYQSSPTQNHLGVLSELPVASAGETAGMTFQKQRGLNPVCPLWWPKWRTSLQEKEILYVDETCQPCSYFSYFLCIPTMSGWKTTLWNSVHLLHEL